MSDARILILWGNDELAISRRVEQLTGAYPDSTTAGMNITRLDARASLNENELNNAVGSMPFLAAERLVILTAPSKHWTGLDGHKKFLAWLETVPLSTRLVIIEPDEIKERERASHWLLKWASKSGGRGKTEGFVQPRAWEMAKWIQDETRRQGGKIESDAAARLAEMVGENARQASQEIIKLLTYLNNPGRAIGIEDVERVSVVTAAGDVFKLVDMLAEGKGREAQSMLARLLQDEEPMGLFGMIIRQFRLLLLARELLNEGASERGVQEGLSVHEYVARKITAQARKFDIETLAAIYRRLLRIDEAVKTGVMPIEPALDVLVMELAGK